MTATSDTRPTAKKRDPRIDAVRGAAIVGVVLGHVLRGLMETGLVTPTAGIGLVNERVVYLIRLPLFVLVTGLLMATSVERRGTGGYLWARVRDVGWVYVLWSLLQGAVEVFTSSVKNTPTTWAEVLNLWVPRAQLWYLPFLIISSVVVVIIKPWRNPPRLLVGLAVAIVISVLGWGHDGATIATRGMSLFVFIMIGAAIGRQRLVQWWDVASRWMLLLLGVSGLALATWLGLHTDAIMPTSHKLLPWTAQGISLGLIGAVAGVVGLSSLVVLLVGAWPAAGRVFALLGRHSMEIYLGHITVMAAVRVLLLKLGVESVALHVFLGTLIGTFACLLITWIAKYVPWLLRAPRLRSRTAPAEVAGTR